MNFKSKLRKLISVAGIMVIVTLLIVVSITRVQDYTSNAEERHRVVLDFDEVSVHDPSIIKVEDTYYVFGSHVAAAKSTDLKNWEYFVNNTVGSNTLLGNIKENFKEVFKWAGNGDTTDVGGMGIWAPDVYFSPVYKNDDGTQGAYLMYFSLSTGQDTPGEEHYRSLIGLAVSQDIEGPYVYKDTIIYTGFRDQPDDYGHWTHTDFKDNFPNQTPRPEYFRSDGRFNFDHFPNAIDPTIVDTPDGKTYMTYGSWNGGVWILEIDPATGLVINRPKTYDHNNDPRFDAYFGTKIYGGFWQTGEGPYLRYHEPTGYYHLYITYGTLDQQGTYNMRFFRSKNILGPYVDIQGNEAHLLKNRDVSRMGNKILGSIDFEAHQTIDENASFFSYRVPGHNSVFYDTENDMDYIVFHTRFKDKGEGHEVRVHQILFNDDGWPLIPLERFHNETIQKDVDVSGTYLMVNQGLDTNPVSKPSFGVTLEEDGSIVGAHTGSWSMDGEILTVTLGRDTFRGYVLNQTTPLTDWHVDHTITLIDEKGVSLLGARIGRQSSHELLAHAVDSLEIGREKGIVNNVTLIEESMGGVKINWSSSNPQVISNKGIVTLQDRPTKVTLTATLRYAGLSEKKTFEVETSGLDPNAKASGENLHIYVGTVGLTVLGALVYIYVIKGKKRPKE